jgi:hypothetical protein
MCQCQPRSHCAESLDKGDAPRLGIKTPSPPALLKVGSADLRNDNLMSFAEEVLARVEPVAKGDRKGDHKLPVRSFRKNILHQMLGGLDHPFGLAGRTETSLLTGEGHDPLLLTALAVKPQKAIGQNPATNIGLKLLSLCRPWAGPPGGEISGGLTVSTARGWPNRFPSGGGASRGGSPKRGECRKAREAAAALRVGVYDATGYLGALDDACK